MKKFWRSNAPVYLGFVLVLGLGVCLWESLQYFPPAQAYRKLWQILVLSLTVTVLRAVWNRRR